MRRFDRVRSLVIPLVFAHAAPVAGGACCGDPILHEEDVDFRNALPEVQALIDRCVRDNTDCQAMCDAALVEVLGGPDEYAFVVECTFVVEANMTGPKVHLVYDDGSVCGRAPTTLVSSGRTSTLEPVAAWLADAAHLEAASVIAFVHLAIDLARLGAPSELVAAAVAASRDEVEHAAVMRALAMGRGATVARVRTGPYMPATLRALALHNATEGCAREMLGAAINVWQSQRATDPALREVFARIAADELRHAELSWRIDAWARSCLPDEDVAAIDHARATTMAALAGLVGATPDRARETLGVPSSEEVRALANVIAASEQYLLRR